MPRPQVMVDLAEGRLRQRPQRFARHHQHVLAEHLFDPHALAGNLLVGRLVLAERKQRRVLVGRNGLLVGKALGAFMERLAGFGGRAGRP